MRYLSDERRERIAIAFGLLDDASREFVRSVARETRRHMECEIMSDLRGVPHVPSEPDTLAQQTPDE